MVLGDDTVESRVRTFDQVQCKKYYREYVHAAEQTNKNYSPWF